MITQELLNYIKQQQGKGVDKQGIKNILLQNGWQDRDVEQAFGEIDSSSSQSPSPIQETPITQPIVSNKTFAEKMIGNSTSHKKRGRLSTLIIILFVVLGGGILYAYYGYMNSPEKVMQKVLTNSTQIKSIAYAVSMNTNSQIDSENIQTKITFDSAYNIENKEDPRLRLALRASSNIINGETVNLGFETRVINKNIYTVITDAPVLGVFDLSPLADQWVVFDFETIKNEIEKQNPDEKLDLDKKSTDLTIEQKGMINNLIKQSKVFEIVDTLTSDEISGEKTFHYSFYIDKDELKNLLIDLKNITEDNFLSADELSGIIEALDSVEFSNGEIWIGRNDYVVKRVTLGLGYKNENTGDTKIDLSFLLKSYNQDLKIDLPTDAIPFEDFMANLFGVPEDF